MSETKERADDDIAYLEHLLAQYDAEHAERRRPVVEQISELRRARDTVYPPAWPARCIKPNSCSRYRTCVYAMNAEQCPHHGRDIGPDVDAALKEEPR